MMIVVASCLDHCKCLYSHVPQYLKDKLKKMLHARIRFISHLPIDSHVALNLLQPMSHIAY